ncbi:hypothetical protein, partial [Streptomyces sp. NPDC059003]|uniref:hypothetical protein n=1 Tax=Streptomyces sp. NPDC059003 TaxID=3346691 RepID=UPI00369CFED0
MLPAAPRTTPTAPAAKDGSNRFQAVRTKRMKGWVVVDTQDHSIAWAATDTAATQECFFTGDGAEGAARRTAHRLNTDPAARTEPWMGAAIRYTRPAQGSYLGTDDVAVLARILEVGTPPDTRGTRMAPRKAGRKTRIARERPTTAITSAGNLIHFWHQEGMPSLKAGLKVHVTGTALTRKIVKNQKTTVLAGVTVEPADQWWDRLYLHQAAPTSKWRALGPDSVGLLRAGQRVRIRDLESPHNASEADESPAYATVTLRERRSDGSWRADAPGARNLIITGKDVCAIEASQAPEHPDSDAPPPTPAQDLPDVSEQLRQQLMDLRYADLRDRWESHLAEGDEVLLISDPHTWQRVGKALPYLFQVKAGTHHDYAKVIARRRDGQVHTALDMPQRPTSALPPAKPLPESTIGAPISELDRNAITQELADLDARSTAAATSGAAPDTVVAQRRRAEARRQTLADAHAHRNAAGSKPEAPFAKRLPPIVDQQFPTVDDLIEHLRDAVARPRAPDRAAEEQLASFCRATARRADAQHVLIPAAAGRLAVVQVKPGNWQVRTPHRLVGLGAAMRVRSPHHALALAEALAAITDAAGLEFPWSDPWADHRMRAFRDAQGRTLDEVLQHIRDQVPEPPEPAADDEDGYAPALQQDAVLGDLAPLQGDGTAPRGGKAVLPAAETDEATTEIDDGPVSPTLALPVDGPGTLPGGGVGTPGVGTASAARGPSPPDSHSPTTDLGEARMPDDLDATPGTDAWTTAVDDIPVLGSAPGAPSAVRSSGPDVLRSRSQSHGASAAA